ncbi:helix-turn-helix domain-containing protein [Pseudorhizobium tarimense]|uniref:helix-turn-helix domain-containing protein n=1 Tax=Pseudorhizobium tarimense TaxID=1079109 RepID=UPI001FF28EBA|nr:helix-turn-helix transcriptional regulator [Pseudorhizobium tarimense]MCJ8521857.1 helix-turn-helix domain-containing protein [Pseudorhizobium tarimense]
METRARIAWNLRRLRSEQKITQEHLAVDANVDRSVISDMERSKHNASVDLLDRLAAALSVDVTEFFKVPDQEDVRPAPLLPGRKPKVGR